MNTGTKDIYIISAIKNTWKSIFNSDFDLNWLQSLNISDEWQTDIYGIPENQIHDKVDCTVIYLDDIDKERYTNSDIVAIRFCHYHKQSRIDNYGVTVYVK